MYYLLNAPFLLAQEMRDSVNLRTKLTRLVTSPAFSSVELPLLEALFDTVSDMTFFVKDASGRYVVVNNSLITRHGLKSKSEAIGKRPCEICSGDFGRLPTDQDTKILRTGKPLIEHLEMHWYRPDEPVWCLTTKLPIRSSEITIAGLIGFSRDVRARVEPDEIPAAFATAWEAFEQRLAADVTPTWLAAQSKLSPQRLARLTKRLFGLTPQQLITKTRITAAATLLRETDKPVSEIAQACGFFDHSAFARSFRSATGVTPTEYRKAHRPDV